MKVLFTTPILEHPAAGGPQLRIENSIKALSRICELHVIVRTSKYLIGGDEAEYFYRQYSKQFSYAPSSKFLSKNRYMRKLQTVASGITGWDTNKDTDFILDYLVFHDINIIWFGYGNISFPIIKKIKQVRPRVKVVCDTDSVWSRFVMRELPYVASKLRRIQIERKGRKKILEEEQWVDHCDITTAVSEVDADYYRGIASEPDKVQLFSNVIDLSTYENAPSPPVDFKKPCIYIAGTFGHYHSPMNSATRWVLQEIFPKVREIIPNIHFYLVGKESEKALKSGFEADPFVTATGKLPSVLPYLCNADVALVPLKYESGTRFKIMEAAACGIPLVSTTLGAEGIPVTNGKDIIIADDSATFAEAIIQLIKDKDYARGLANNCRELVCEHNSIESLALQAQNILDILK